MKYAMFVGAVVAMAALGLVGSGCSELGLGGKDDEKPAKSTGSGAKATGSGATGASGPTAGAGAAGRSLADRFGGEVPAGTTARAILRAGSGTGVIVLVPSEFGPGSGVYGDGYGTHSSNSAVGFAIEQVGGIDPRVPQLSVSVRKILCYPLKVDQFQWEAPADVAIGSESLPATVWKGQGVHLGDKKPWGVYAISTVVLKNKRVRGCGAWDLASPAAEEGVVVALKSIRTGIAGPTDPGYP
jgi:hypothetical protein